MLGINLYFIITILFYFYNFRVEGYAKDLIHVLKKKWLADIYMYYYGVPFVQFMHLVFTRIPGRGYHRWFRAVWSCPLSYMWCPLSTADCFVCHQDGRFGFDEAMQDVAQNNSATAFSVSCPHASVRIRYTISLLSLCPVHMHLLKSGTQFHCCHCVLSTCICLSQVRNFTAVTVSCPHASVSQVHSFTAVTESCPHASVRIRYTVSLLSLCPVRMHLFESGTQFHSCQSFKVNFCTCVSTGYEEKRSHFKIMNSNNVTTGLIGAFLLLSFSAFFFLFCCFASFITWGLEVWKDFTCRSSPCYFQISTSHANHHAIFKLATFWLDR